MCHDEQRAPALFVVVLFRRLSRMDHVAGLHTKRHPTPSHPPVAVSPHSLSFSLLFPTTHTALSLIVRGSVFVRQVSDTCRPADRAAANGRVLSVGERFVTNIPLPFHALPLPCH